MSRKISIFMDSKDIGGIFDRQIYKLIINFISPHITHLINCIINTGVYPKIHKLCRITPIKKPDKPDDDIDSY